MLQMGIHGAGVSRGLSPCRRRYALRRRPVDPSGRPILTHPEFIPVSAPALVGNEKKYVLDCMESAWISSNGKYIDLFEASFREFCRTKHAISCSNGTVALHVPLGALNVQPGDEVLVPALTFVATANAVTYCGARPVF